MPTPDPDTRLAMWMAVAGIAFIAFIMTWLVMSQ